MKTDWLNIAIEIGILGLMGLCYYLYQKKRIIRTSRNDLDIALSEFRLKINEYAQNNKSSQNFKQIKSFTDLFEQKYSDNALKELISIKEESHVLSKDLVDEFTLIISQIEDHLSSE